MLEFKEMHKDLKERQDSLKQRLKERAKLEEKKEILLKEHHDKILNIFKRGE